MERIAVFRADASPALGGGHVMRCLALADGLSHAGWRCSFWVAPGTLEAVPALAGSRHEVVFESPRYQRVQLLVVDHYSLGAAFEASCRSWARHILAIDDLADRRHDCDILLDQTLGRVDTDYRELTPSFCVQLLGPQYALLRPDFAGLRGEALARRHGNLERILVSLGSSDPRDITGLALDALEQAGLDAAVDVVLGSVSPNCAAVAGRLQNWPRARFHHDTSRMAELMAVADIAVGAAGVTSWERCTVGLPCAMVVTADNQRLIARALNDAGAAVLVGDWRAMTAARLAGALRCMAKPRKLQAISIAAAGVCDGNGVARAVAQVEKLL